MEINEKELEFVSRHYKKGRLNTDKAWGRLRGSRTTSPLQLAGLRRETEQERGYKAIAASVAIVLGLSVALAYNWSTIFPSTEQEVVDKHAPAMPIIEAKDSCVVLKYDNEPIGKILGELSGYYHCNVSTEDSTRCVTGELEATSLNEVVDILQTTLNIKITVK